MPLNWDKLRIFHMVAESGSFTEAGTRLNSSQSSISRQIKALEDHLNISLFTRHARGLVLTTEGQQLFSTTRIMAQELDDTARELIEAKGKPSGLLRVTTMVTFGAVWLSSHLSSFMEQYPEIEVQLILNDDDLDLQAGQADVAIRLHEVEQSDLIIRPLAEFHNHIYASPEYIDRNGMPTCAEDLDDHDLIAYGDTSSATIKDLQRILTIGRSGRNPRKARFMVNNMYGVYHAVKRGMGLATLPDYLVHSGSPLVRVMPDTDSISFPSFFCYPPEMRGSKRVNVFRDFLVQAIRADSNLL